MKTRKHHAHFWSAIEFVDDGGVGDAVFYTFGRTRQKAIHKLRKQIEDYLVRGAQRARLSFADYLIKVFGADEAS